MKLSTKAAIYSAVIFPGAGFFIVNKKRTGYAFLIMTLACLWPIIHEVFYKSRIIVDKIVQGELANDFLIIQDQILTQPGVIPDSVLTGTSMAIAFLWLLGVIEAYRFGRTLETTGINQ